MRPAVVAAHHCFHSFSPVQTSPEREGGRRQGRSQGVTPAMWSGGYFLLCHTFVGHPLGTSLNMTGPPTPSSLK